jgi:hypothetical protein
MQGLCEAVFFGHVDGQPWGLLNVPIHAPIYAQCWDSYAAKRCAKAGRAAADLDDLRLRCIYVY